MTDGYTGRAAGLVLVGTQQWTGSTFDTLMPRALLPVAHKPLVSYALSWLADHGIARAAVCGNRDTQILRSVLDQHVPARMHVSYHQDQMPRGAAGSLRDAALTLDADVFIVADGTSVPTVPVADLLAAHRASGAAVTVVVTEEQRRYGKAEIQVPAGIYVFERRVLDVIPATGFCDIKEKLLPMLYRSGECVVPYVTDAPTPRALCASTYLALNEWVVEQLGTGGATPAGYVRRGQAFVHHEAQVSPDAVLLGPIVVAAGARIGAEAVIVGPASIGCDAVIEAGAMVSRSAVWRRATVGAHAVANRCLLADDAVVERGGEVLDAVLVGLRGAQTKPAADRVGLAELLEMPAMEMARKVARLLSGAEWSRSPAAQ